MAILLNRAELFTLLSLIQAGPIVGLDPTFLLPKDPDDHQALYQAGRQWLTERDLLRVDSNGSLALEHGLREIMRTVIRPELALLLVKVVPGQGRQMYLHSLLEGQVVEHTLPAAGAHRLAVVGGPGALVDRLHALLPVSAAPYPPASVRAPAASIVSVFDLAERVQHLGATDIVSAVPGTPIDLAARLALVFTDLTFGASLSFFKPEESTRHPVQGLMILQNIHGAWGITLENAGQEALIEHMNSAVLQTTLRSVFGVSQAVLTGA